MSLGCSVVENLPSFTEVVENVRNGDPAGLDQLYTVFRILSGSLRRQMGYQDFDDRIHDMFIVVVEAIRDGKLREPGALSSYIFGVARFSLCSKIGLKTRHERLAGTLRHWVVSRHRTPTPEDTLAERERAEIMRDLLSTLSLKEREILTRFYLDEQPKDQICREMALSDTQFRLAKSRAKQRLSRMGHDLLSVFAVADVTESARAA
jgi:RNA polymerase sigma-70 factor (ECF subfamily)